MIALRLRLDFANAACRSAFEELPERLAGHSYSVDYLPASDYPVLTDAPAPNADKPGATTDLSIGGDPDVLSRWACTCRFAAAADTPLARLGANANASLPQIEWGLEIFIGPDALDQFLRCLPH